MLQNLKTIALAGAASIMMVGAASAATIYDATDITSGGDHAVWFASNSNPFGGNQSWKFTSPGTYTTYTQGGMEFASLEGTIEQKGGSGLQMTIDAVFKLKGIGDAFGGPGNDTKCGSVGSAGTGECVGDDNWAYYTYDSVLLEGLGTLAGLTLGLSDQTGGNIPAQEGTGANDKDGGYGFSTWFDWEVKKNDSSFVLAQTTGIKGDINIKLGDPRAGQDPEPVPLPAGGVLLLTALAGLGIARRRKQRA